MVFIAARHGFTLLTRRSATRTFSTSHITLRNAPSPVSANDGPLEGIRVLDLTRVLGKLFHFSMKYLSNKKFN